ncbi:MAG: DNA cytosine methyltransferase [Bacteroidales bacterium]|nr:DNA cytosine methyltransferase [Bacteroidales bacterium]
MATVHIKEERNLKKFTVIDLFAGWGWLSLGLYLAGWQGVFAIEKNPNAFETLKYNLIDKYHRSGPVPPFSRIPAELVPPVF